MLPHKNEHIILTLMKKGIIALLIIFFIGLSVPYFWNIYYLLPIKKPQIHVFFEGFATAPAFSQIIEFSKLPKETKKIIAWHRFPNRKNIINLAEYNTVEVDLPQQEGNIEEKLQAFSQVVQQIADENPFSTLVFHTSFDKVQSTLKPLLNMFPKNRISHIHLYEDGYGDLFKWTDKILKAKTFYKPNLKQETLNLLNPDTDNPWKIAHVFGLRYHYLVSYHFLNASKIKQDKRFQKMFLAIKDANLHDINFDVFAHTLTTEQKQVIYRLSGFDYNKFKPLIKDKKTIVFVMGYHFNNQNYINAEQTILHKLKTNQLEDFPFDDGKNYIWFYKAHPSWNAKVDKEKFEHRFPDMIEIPAQVPFEVLILAGLKPSFTAGFSSSLFFSLHPEDILLYIKRPIYLTSPLSALPDHYLTALVREGNIRKNQAIDLHSFLNNTQP